MVPAVRSDNDVCSNARSQLDGQRTCSSSRTGNQECFSFLEFQLIVDRLVSCQPVDWKCRCMQGIERGWSWSDQICRNSHILGIMPNTNLIGVPTFFPPIFPAKQEMVNDLRSMMTL